MRLSGRRTGLRCSRHLLTQAACRTDAHGTPYHAPGEDAKLILGRSGRGSKTRSGRTLQPPPRPIFIARSISHTLIPKVAVLVNDGLDLENVFVFNPKHNRDDDKPIDGDIDKMNIYRDAIP